MAGNDVTKTPGYDRLSPESQEQLKLAFEDGRVAGKDFKDIRSDLAGSAPPSGARKFATQKAIRSICLFAQQAVERASARTRLCEAS